MAVGWASTGYKKTLVMGPTPNLKSCQIFSWRFCPIHLSTPFYGLCALKSSKEGPGRMFNRKNFSQPRTKHSRRFRLSRYEFISAVENRRKKRPDEVGEWDHCQMGTQTGRHDATYERARSQSVSQSVSDRFDVDGKSAALASGPEISERQRRHAGIRHKRERREGYILISGS